MKATVAAIAAICALLLAAGCGTQEENLPSGAVPITAETTTTQVPTTTEESVKCSSDHDLIWSLEYSVAREFDDGDNTSFAVSSASLYDLDSVRGVRITEDEVVCFFFGELSWDSYLSRQSVNRTGMYCYNSLDFAWISGGAGADIESDALECLLLLRSS